MHITGAHVAMKKELATEARTGPRKHLRFPTGVSSTVSSICLLAAMQPFPATGNRCGPCKLVEPIVKDIASSYPDTIKVRAQREAQAPHASVSLSTIRVGCVVEMSAARRFLLVGAALLCVMAVCGGAQTGLKSDPPFCFFVFRSLRSTLTPPEDSSSDTVSVGCPTLVSSMEGKWWMALR